MINRSGGRVRERRLMIKQIELIAASAACLIAGIVIGYFVIPDPEPLPRPVVGYHQTTVAEAQLDDNLEFIALQMQLCIGDKLALMQDVVELKQKFRVCSESLDGVLTEFTQCPEGL